MIYHTLSSVTILILIDGFLQYQIRKKVNLGSFCHNPYFNRWFSAIHYSDYNDFIKSSHNPYFNRWFSAIENDEYEVIVMFKSQSLF